jgi:F-type H+-transporting ATPase subunit b
MYDQVKILLAEEGGTHNPILPIWQEMVMGLIAFGLLVLILGKFVWPKMEQTFQARVEAIEGGIKRAEQKQAEAGALLEQYQQQLAEARTDAARIRDEARADAVAIREELITKAREESDRIIASGREALAAERTTVARQLRAELGTLAVDLAERIVGEALADNLQQRQTVDRFITELDGTGGNGTSTTLLKGRP